MIAIAFADGTHSNITASDGNLVTLVGGKSAAPGTPLLATATLKDSQHAVRIKVAGCRRVAEEQFEIRGRFVDLSKELRALILHELSVHG